MTETMTLRLSRDQANMLEIVARAQGSSKSDVVRKALDAHVKLLQNDPDFQVNLAKLKQAMDSVRQTLTI